MAHIHPSGKLLAKLDTCRHEDIEQQIMAALKQNPGSQIQWELICEIHGKEPQQNLSSGTTNHKMRKSRESLRVTRSRIDSPQGKPGHHLHTAPKAGASMAAGLENRATNSRYTTNIVQNTTICQSERAVYETY